MPHTFPCFVRENHGQIVQAPVYVHIVQIESRVGVGERDRKRSPFTRLGRHNPKIFPCAILPGNTLEVAKRVLEVYADVIAVEAGT